VVRVARGQAVLVDGGGTPFSDFDVGARIVVPALRALGVGALPAVVATHADADHVEGLVAVLHAFPVGALWIGHPAPERRSFVDLVGGGRGARRPGPRGAARRGVPRRRPDARRAAPHPPVGGRAQRGLGGAAAALARRAVGAAAGRRAGPGRGQAAGAAHAAAAGAPPRLGLEHLGPAAAGGPAGLGAGCRWARTATATRRRASWRAWRRTAWPCAPRRSEGALRTPYPVPAPP
jgi:hypothetical protein